MKENYVVTVVSINLVCCDMEFPNVQLKYVIIRQELTDAMPEDACLVHVPICVQHIHIRCRLLVTSNFQVFILSIHAFTAYSRFYFYSQPTYITRQSNFLRSNPVSISLLSICVVSLKSWLDQITVTIRCFSAFIYDLLLCKPQTNFKQQLLLIAATFFSNSELASYRFLQNLSFCSKQKVYLSSSLLWSCFLYPFNFFIHFGKQIEMGHIFFLNLFHIIPLPIYSLVLGLQNNQWLCIQLQTSTIHEAFCYRDRHCFVKILYQYHITAFNLYTRKEYRFPVFLYLLYILETFVFAKQ